MGSDLERENLLCLTGGVLGMSVCTSFLAVFLQSLHDQHVACVVVLFLFPNEFGLWLI